MGRYTLSIGRLFRRTVEKPRVLLSIKAISDAAIELVRRGIAREESGEIASAMQYYHEAIGADPEFAQAHMCLGIALHASGQAAAAISAHQQAIKLEPTYAAAHYNLGLAYLKTGANARAEAGFRNSLDLRADFPEAWVGLADALEALGREADALAALDNAIVQREHYVGALFNASVLLRKMGRIRESEARLREIDLEALFATGRHAEAEEVSRRLIQARPEDGLAWKVLGAVLAVQREFEAAVTAFRRALASQPSDPETHHNLAISLHALARFSEAEASYRRALEFKPDYHEAHNNLANVLLAQARFTEAEAHCRRALALKPDFYAAHSDLGNLLEAIGRPSEALKSYRRAIALSPDYHVAHNNLAASLVTLGRLTEAEANCRRALELKPGYREGHDNLLFLLNYQPDKSPIEVYSAYQNFDTCFGQPLRSEWRDHANDRLPGRRLRVGYVSPDFRTHAVRHFFEPLVDRHDKSAVEIFAYAEVPIEDQVTVRIKARVDRWVSTCGLSDAHLADRIRADQIDILVDLAGHTRGNRLLAFARRPAPVSVTTIGFGYTTGLSSIDWFLTDKMVVPEGEEHLFAERPWRIPLCQVYRPAEDMGAVSALPALERGYVTFGTLTRAARINHRVIRVWSAILRRVPRSRLRIDSLNFRDNELCESLAVEFAAHGIAKERLQIGFHSPPWDVMREYDVTLDCFPQNSGTTLFESLYMGIPFITLKDRVSLGRLGASIAAHAGHAEWIADTEEEYVEKAVGLVANLEDLALVRSCLREEMRVSSLMDESGYVRHVEAAYREMWRRWCMS